MKKRILFLSRLSVLAVITLTASMVMAAGTPPPVPPNPLYPPGIGWNPVVDYTLPNFAQSPNIRKFVDSLPGLGVANANNLGQYIPIATPDTTTFPGDNVSSAANPASDYYEIAVREYHQKMHTDMPATQLRGYGQINSADPTVNNVSQYLGPMVIAHRYDPTKPAGVNGNGKPVRVKYFNQLPTGAAGNLPLPVDNNIMGAGSGPNGGLEMYTQNRIAIHLHGGDTPWISDGTPSQWIVPAGEITSYGKGVSNANVPDMISGVNCRGGATCFTPVANDGRGTLYYPNQQSARLMFYHDHAYGITRLNVYDGMAAPYLLVDQYEEDLISGTNVMGANPTNAKVLPDLGGVYHYGIPLVIQDKAFVNDATTPPGTGWPASGYTPTPQTLATDPLWQYYVGTTGGNLWMGHEYMPVENPYDPSGNTPNGRWDYAPFMIPPMLPLNLTLPSPTLIPEAFGDTMVVNGTAFPYLTLPPDAVRFRILNAGNDRSLNLSLFYAKDRVTGNICKAGNSFTVANCTEVSMVPAAPNNAFPTWPRDGRDGGVPDPLTKGPDWIQIGSEGGFLAKVAVIPAQPVDYNYDRQVIPLVGVTSTSLLLIPADRDDVIADFSSASSGDVFMLYNDGPAAMPNYWPLNDYYTDSVDQTSVGGAPSTAPGFGPNTRTVMQIRIAGSKTSSLDYSVPNGSTLVALKAALPKTFAASQPPILVPQLAYNDAYPTGPHHYSGAADSYVQGYQTTLNLTGTVHPLTRILTVAPGNNYPTPPNVVIVGGGGTGATATAGLNPIGGITLLTTGTGYTSTPTVTLGAPDPAGAGVTRVQATASATISGGGVNAINIEEPGANYINAVTLPTCAITGGGGTGATCSVLAPTLNTVGSIVLTNPGSGYMQQPQVFLVPTTPGGQAASAIARITGDLPMTGKNLTEGFDVDFGRMDIRLGSTPNPLTPSVGAGFAIGIARYIDPPTEIFNSGEPILWRLTHLGVDSHAMHFHLFNLQVVNHVDWTNVIKPPYDDEIGWKEVIRTTPMEDIIVAIRPKASVLPFTIPDSIRVLDPTTPVNSTTNFYPVAPPPGVPAVAQQSNVMTNFGWEYVWHCHLLGHEENDMMRPMVLMVQHTLPLAAGRPTATATPGHVALAWARNASNVFDSLATGYMVQRANGTTGTVFSTISTSYDNNVLTYDDTSVAASTGYNYRIVAFNGIGSAPASATRSVTSSSLAAAPSVVMTSPSNGAMFAAPASIPMTATATPGAGRSISKVEYYYGTSLVGSSATGPSYAASFDNVNTGVVTLHAMVYDNVGVTAVSTPVTVTVGTPNPASAAAVIPSPVSPQVPGASVSWGASASGGSGSYQYQFWLNNGTSWSIAQAYSSNATWTWNTTGLATGTYYVQVWARNTGSSAAYEAYTAVTPYVLAGAVPPTQVLLTPPPSPASPQVPGASVLWTAAASGGSGNYEYQFWLNNGTSWSIARPYSTTATWTWNTTGLAAGTYYVQVWARSVGSLSSVEAFTPVTSYALIASLPATGVTLTPPPSPASPQAIGASVLWTAAASGGSGTYEYEFWLYNGTSWSIARSYSATATWTWNTTGLAAGTYYVQVWARNAGSAAAYEAFTPATSYVLQ